MFLMLPGVFLPLETEPQVFFKQSVPHGSPVQTPTSKAPSVPFSLLAQTSLFGEDSSMISNGRLFQALAPLDLGPELDPT